MTCCTLQQQGIYIFMSTMSIFMSNFFFLSWKNIKIDFGDVCFVLGVRTEPQQTKAKSFAAEKQIWGHT